MLQLAALLLGSPSPAMLFVPSLVGPNGSVPYGLWDQSGLIAPDGTWRMWYDAQGQACNLTTGGAVSGSGLCGFGLATSDDGVRWRDEGLTMRPFDQPALGSGAVWRSPSDPDEWVLNYSDECNEPAIRRASNCTGQQIRFQTSRNASLRGPWRPRPDVPPFVPSEALGYSSFRWDTINPYFDAESKTLYGWWTAGLPTDGPAGGPGKAGQSAMGFGTSADGVHWKARAPAILTWPSATNVTAGGFEIGGVAPITSSGGQRRWYASVCMSHQELPAAIDGRVGCFTFVAAQPGGPYTIAAKNAAILGYGQRGRDPEYAYYHRFLHARGELLTHYQVYDKAHWKREHGVTCYLTPLKRMVVDEQDGALRMMYWNTNEALKAPPAMPVERGRLTIESGSGGIVEGTVVWGEEGGLCFPYSDGGPRPGTSFVAGLVRVNRTHVLMGEASSLQCTASTSVTNDTMGVTDHAAEPSRGLRLRSGDKVAWRLMFRRGMLDLYVQDALLLSYALAVGGKPYNLSQDVHLVGSWAGAVDVVSWRMNLPADDT